MGLSINLGRYSNLYGIVLFSLWRFCTPGVSQVEVVQGNESWLLFSGMKVSSCSRPSCRWAVKPYHIVPQSMPGWLSQSSCGAGHRFSPSRWRSAHCCPLLQWHGALERHLSVMYSSARWPQVPSPTSDPCVPCSGGVHAYYLFILILLVLFVSVELVG